MIKRISKITDAPRNAETLGTFGPNEKEGAENFAKQMEVEYGTVYILFNKRINQYAVLAKYAVLLK